MKIKPTLLAALSVIFLQGCMSGSNEVYFDGPAEDKSIMVPPGIRGISGAIKRTFKSSGWVTYVTGKSVVSTGTVGKYTNVTTGAKYPARYSAFTAQQQFDWCIGGGPALHYDISIVDNKTGQEVAVFSGSNCEKAIEKELKATLAGFL